MLFCFCHEGYYINTDVDIKSVRYKLMLCLRDVDVDIAINILWSTTCAYNLISYKISQTAAAFRHLQLPDRELIAEPSWRHFTCYKITFKNLQIFLKSIIMNLPDQVHVTRNVSEIWGFHHRVDATRGCNTNPVLKIALATQFCNVEPNFMSTQYGNDFMLRFRRLEFHGDS